MSQLPPDIETRALALQAAITALGKEGVIRSLHETTISDPLKQVTAEFVQYIRTGHWDTEMETPE